jgi:hypothetical protein
VQLLLLLLLLRAVPWGRVVACCGLHGWRHMRPVVARAMLLLLLLHRAAGGWRAPGATAAAPCCFGCARRAQHAAWRARTATTSTALHGRCSARAAQRLVALLVLRCAGGSRARCLLVLRL